jgi:lipopolysaccharide assembly outer membrane protein LptD (OstA)
MQNKTISVARSITKFNFSTRLSWILVRCIAIIFLNLTFLHVSGQSNQDSASQLATDTLSKPDTLHVPQSSSALKSPIIYKAKDSIVYDILHTKVYLYGDVNVKYEDVDLSAAQVSYNWQTNTLFAEPGTDSVGNLTGYPVFKQGGTTVTTKTIAYNFISKKGRVSDLITQQGEGYIRGDTVKTLYQGEKQVSYVKNGIYTTCDYAKIPGHELDYYFKTRKLKLISGDKVVTGMANLYIEGVPTPLILPFGFFPANSRKTSGIIPPSVLYSATKGYALHGGGLYIAASKYFDVALTTDIYTKGDYLLQEQTRYARRYHFNGSLTFSVARNSYGLEDAPGFSRSNDYNFQWTHNQDPKAHPGTSFSASVNFPSSHYITNNLYYTPAVLTQNVNSSISYSKNWANSPFSLGVSAQNSLILDQAPTNTVKSVPGITPPNMTFTLPNASLSMTRIFPFKTNTGSKRWYSDIGISGNVNIINSLTTTDSTFRNDITNIGNYRNGGTISVPLSTSFKVLKWFTLSPSINYNGYLYTRKFIRSDYTPADSVRIETLNGLYMANDANASMSLSTNIYGMFKIKRGRILAIRHVLTPILNAVYSPDFANPKYGYYRDFVQDRSGKVVRYSPYAGYNDRTQSLVAIPAMGAQGSINFNLQNNLEMKVKTKNDSQSSTKKIKLLDPLNILGYYNFLDTSFYKLSDIRIDLRTTLFQNFSVSFSTLLSPYVLDKNGVRKPEYKWHSSRSPGTFTSSNLSFQGSLKPKDRKGVPIAYNPLYGYFYPQPYVDFDMPWNLGYSFNLLYDRFAKDNKFSKSVYLNGDFALTSKWHINFNSGYDFSNKQVTLTQISIVRDLHCWEARLDWTPFGPYRNYMFNIRIKASSLKDLKLEKKKAYYDF